MFQTTTKKEENLTTHNIEFEDATPEKINELTDVYEKYKTVKSILDRHEIRELTKLEEILSNIVSELEGIRSDNHLDDEHDETQNDQDDEHDHCPTEETEETEEGTIEAIFENMLGAIRCLRDDLKPKVIDLRASRC